MKKKKKTAASSFRERIVDSTVEDAEFTFGLGGIKVTKEEIAASVEAAENEGKAKE
jgi:hypothetical protein